MEVIGFDGYTTEEKLAIAQGYLWPRQLERNGLRADEVEASDAILRKVVTEYTREAGVRQLERELGKLLRKRATRIASGRRRRPSPSILEAVIDALGRQRFFQESVERTAIPGVATGLAVTGTGGDVLFIEATAMEGDRGPGADGPARRRDEGVGADRALIRELARRPAGDRRSTTSGASSTSMCPQGRSPRTGRAREPR